MTNSGKTGIRNFQTHTDLEFAARLTRQEGWHSETLLELQSFYEHDPQSCFIYEVDGLPVGMCIATAYHHTGFIGELIVESDYRHHGFGRELMRVAIDFLRKNQIQAIFLDGVQKAVPLYDDLGFKPICRSLRLFGQIHAEESKQVFPMTEQDLQEVVSLDKQYFGDDRSFFLQKRWKNYPHLARVLKAEQQIVGYIFGRTGQGGWVTAGPWINTSPDPTDLTLLSHFQATIGNQPFSIGLLESRKAVIQALVMSGMQPRPDPPLRMIFGSGNNLGDNQFCYAIGSPAKG